MTEHSILYKSWHLVGTYHNPDDQQNDVLEKKDKTIVDMVRSALERGDILKLSQYEAVNWNVPIMNRSLTIAIKNLIKQEVVRCGKKHVVDFFRCITYAHNSNVKRTKLDNNAEICVFSWCE